MITVISTSNGQVSAEMSTFGLAQKVNKKGCEFARVESTQFLSSLIAAGGKLWMRR